jgi:hypothetical protein
VECPDSLIGDRLEAAAIAQNSFVRARIRQRAVLSLPALWDAAESPKSMPEPTMKNVSFVQGGHRERLERHHGESK